MTTPIKERPILFSAPMVRATLDGRKTMTREVVKPRKDRVFGCDLAQHEIAGEVNNGDLSNCPYGRVGDRLWVRETCRAKELSDDEAEDRAATAAEEDVQYGLDGVEYLADHYFRPIENTQRASERWLDLNSYRGKRGATVPSIHMPRWACRIELKITGVRVERLQDISEEDAKVEGAEIGIVVQHDKRGKPVATAATHRVAFQHLWITINGAGSWDANPWVWVIEFKRVKP
jgi:hypothetical protein